MEKKLEDLPDEMLMKILIELPIADLSVIRRSNKRINKLCNNDYFWAMKLEHDFGIVLPRDKYSKALSLYKRGRLRTHLLFLKDKDKEKEKFLAILNDSAKPLKRQGYIEIGRNAVIFGTDCYFFRDSPVLNLTFSISEEEGKERYLNMIQSGTDNHIFIFGEDNGLVDLILESSGKNILMLFEI